MANFKTTIITKKGHALMAKLSANVATMKFTKVCSSDFDYSNLNNSELEQVITFKNLKQTVLPDLITVVNTTTVKVSATITNTNLSEGYYLRTIGLFALDPDDGEILYSITPTTEADYMAADNGITKSGISLDLLTTISNSENVSLEVDPNAMISAETFNNVVGNVSDLENGGTNLVDGINKNTARLNDLANPSLLINGDFRNPVNQRRKSSYNVNGEYTIDRWRFINDNNGTMTINDGYISISNGVANNTYLQYNYDTDMKVLEGEKVTFTIVYKSTATYRLSSFIGSAEEDVNIYLTPIDDWTVKTLTLDLSSWKYSIGKVESSIILQSYDGSSFTNGTLDVKYIKLELGSVATPFIPRPYGEELTMCQRYYEVIDRVFRTTSFTLGDGMFAIEYPFLVEKRVPPTVVLPSDKTELIEVVGARNSTPTNLECFTTIGGVRFTGVLANDANRIVGLNFRTYADAEIY